MYGCASRSFKKMALIDGNDNIILPEKYQFCGNINDGIFLVWDDGKFGYMNIEGEIVIPFIHSGAYPFKNGMAVVKEYDQYGVINLSGEILMHYNHYQMRNIGENQFAIGDSGSSWIFVNLDNVRIGKHALIYRDFSDFVEGVATVSFDIVESHYANEYKRKWYYIDNKGEIVIRYPYYSCSSFKNGIACVKNEKCDKYTHFIDKKGKVLYSLPYSFPGTFEKHGLCVAREGINQFDCKYGVVDKIGKIVVPFEYNWMSANLEEQTVLAYKTEDERLYILEIL